MNSHKEAQIRSQLAKGFLKEAQQDSDLQRWRSCVDNAQLSCENSAKAAIALFEPPEKSHEPSEQLFRIIGNYDLPPDKKQKLERLADLARQLGWEIHVLSDYGDVSSGRLPWDIYGEKEAKQALDTAQSALKITLELVI